MNKFFSIVLATGVFYLFSFACSPPQVKLSPEGSQVTCIQGTVLYQSPVDSAQTSYANATVTAWRRDKNEPLVETKADDKGRFCIEVPLGDFSVDLRVWGLERFEGQNYICEGSADNIALGGGPKRCGAGDCTEVSIAAHCRERLERRRR